MNKKEYQRPDVKVILIESNSILAGSTGATGEDAPWAAKHRGRNFIDVDENLYLDEE